MENKKIKSYPKEYSEANWCEEVAIDWSFYCCNHICAQNRMGSCNLPCLSCGAVGFYGPRIEIDESSKEIKRKYRACKFCGWFQEAFGSVLRDHGGKPWRCRMVYCEACKIFDWKSPWADIGNHGCGNPFKVINWPVDVKEEEHHFWERRKAIKDIHEQIEMISRLKQ